MAIKQPPRFMAILSCGHTTPVITDKKGLEYCWRCHKLVEIKRTWPEYYNRCLNCRYSKPYGAGQFLARRAAQRHAHTYPLHHLIVYRGGEVWEEYKPKPIESLELTGDDPPF